MRSLIKRILDGIGIRRVHCTGSPIEALSMARTRRVDLIISDYNMPEMNGLKLLANVRSDAATQNPAFIMLSGSGECTIVEKAVQLGVTDYIVKPFPEAIVRQKICSILKITPPKK